ncbi:MAG: ECF-type sigma factor [Planctomycetia bacterium]|jgi:DNA-directed RNA polymerase specialized sigma24 family protein
MNDVTQWISQLGHGNPEAAEAIWQAYFGRLVNYARRKLDGVAKRSADEEDVALSAMYSFCRGMEAGRFEKVDDREDLWKLLVTITARKACAQRRHNMAAKRGGGRVRGESFFGSPDDSQNYGIGEILGSEPTPELSAKVVDDCHALLDELGDETLRQIALLTLEGYRTAEIAKKLDCVPRTIERKLARIREKWERHLQHNPPEN